MANRVNDLIRAIDKEKQPKASRSRLFLFTH
jgi:hypothetical protein